MFRFADDLVACVPYQTDAESFLKSLGHRMEGFHLELAEEQPQRLECGRYARANAYRRGENPKDVEGRGMTFLCGNTRQGAFQGYAQDFSQETEADTGSVYGWDTSIPLPPAHGRTASSGQGADSEASELLCHHGQLRALQAVWASDASGAVQMAQSAEPSKAYTWEGFPQAMRHAG